MNWPVILTLSALVLLLAVLRGLQALRHTKGTERGVEPGEGYTKIEANYSSGLGGHTTEYYVPRDPQEYAKTFIPRDRKQND